MRKDVALMSVMIPQSAAVTITVQIHRPVSSALVGPDTNLCPISGLAMI